ncbi:MAG: hypothetical protein ACREMX_13870 [Gemmatimonadales bacterium]
MIGCRLLPAVLVMSAACQPSTTRPPFTPLPEAAATEIRLPVQEATRQLADVLRADSIPPARVRVRDGYIETLWLDSATGRPTRRRPIGTSVVRVRAWADPARPGNTLLTVETLYRPYADPSLPERELEHQVPRTHPLAVKVENALAALLKRYGGPPKEEPVQPRQPVDAEVPALDEPILDEPPPSEE